MSDFRRVTPEKCYEESLDSRDALVLDFQRAKFIMKKEYMVNSISYRLSYLWLFLEPLLSALVFFFVFSVIRADFNLASLFIGLAIIRGFTIGMNSGLSTRILDGGLKIDRVSSRAITIAFFMKLVVDSLFAASGVAAILVIFFESGVIAILALFVVNIVISFCSYSFYSIFQFPILRSPDFGRLLKFTGMAMFFGSPVLYPLGMTTGFHRTICIYNPFSYFVEPVRYLALGSTDYLLLKSELALVYSLCFSVLLLLCMLRIEKVRWETSTWA